MNEETQVDYGPLAGLIGVWEGDKGMDIAPEPDGIEENPYYETITYEACGELTNANKQIVAGIYYRQTVRRKSDNNIFHDQIGYWMWDAKEKTIMNGFVIPRAVSVLAGNIYEANPDEAGNIIIEVTAKLNDKNWGIIQSPFMQNNALTTAFEQKIIIGKNKLSYSETTMLDIYGKPFEHTDDNSLILK